MKSMDSESEKIFLMWVMIKKAELKKDPNRRVHGQNMKKGFYSQIQEKYLQGEGSLAGQWKGSTMTVI